MVNPTSLLVVGNLTIIFPSVGSDWCFDVLSDTDGVDEIEKAKTLIESHLHYREVFRDMKAKRINMIDAAHSVSKGKPPMLAGGGEIFGSKESISSETPAASTIDSMDRSSVCGTLDI
mmetsp:Transcript_7497/g.6257  ORF Transcript_7497/g.6257 Transcript_7497/m.6257 type:complete len:118 (+) Transcript_7497:287-640(+)